MTTLDDFSPTFDPRTARSIPRQTLGGLSLLLVVALTFGAARSGALLSEAGGGVGAERAAAMLPKTVVIADRRLQRERPEVRCCVGPTAVADQPSAPRSALRGDRAEGRALLREGLIDLPPPARA